MSVLERSVEKITYRGLKKLSREDLIVNLLNYNATFCRIQEENLVLKKNHTINFFQKYGLNMNLNVDKDTLIQMLRASIVQMKRDREKMVWFTKCQKMKLTKNNYTAEEVAKLLHDAEVTLVGLKTHYGSNQNETLCNRSSHITSLNWDEVNCRACLKRRDFTEKENK